MLLIHSGEGRSRGIYRCREKRRGRGKLTAPYVLTFYGLARQNNRQARVLLHI